MKVIARYIVATMAGAGLGASAALVRRHLLSQEGGALDNPLVDESPVASGETGPAASQGMVAPPPAPSAADVADLDAARVRLRERAAALRAEMEGSAGAP